MDDFLGCVVGFLLATTAIVLIAAGVGWLFTDGWLYLLIGAIIAAAMLVVRYRNKRTAVDTLALEEQAKHVEETLCAARRQLNREVDALRNLHLGQQDEVNFVWLRQQHHASRLVADGWYNHKRSALETRRELSDGLNEIRETKRQLARRRDRSRGRLRTAIVSDLQETQTVIDCLYESLSSIDEEIRKGSTAVGKHNRETGMLRDHIRDHCGARGRQWFERLEARKQQRMLDE